jgi:hypothetical protein
MGLIDTEQFRKKFFELEIEFRPSQIDAVFECLESSELVDAEPVIRCKDCKHRSYGTVEGKHLCMLDRYRFFPTTDEDYCSHAEREDE